MMIECNNLVLGYKDPLTEPFSLSIEDNKWLGIIGENGSGKSTFFRTILSEIKPLSGTIRIFDKTPGVFNRLISYIPQEREINLADKMTGFTLIKSCHSAWKYGFDCLNNKLNHRIYELAELVGATSYILQPFNNLSGGQKKKIFLAQALINKPKLLLLDEPLADLDTKSKHHFIQTLRDINAKQKIGLLMISHDMHEIASYLDAFIHLKKSKVHYCSELPCIKEDSYVGL